MERKRHTVKKRGSYLRFLYSLYPSWSVTYSNPFSMSCLDCSTVWAVLHMQLSSCSSVSSWVYIRVWFMLWCPSCCLTYSMSLVCRYSIVAKQCLRSQSRIVLIEGLFSLLAVLFLVCLKHFPYMSLFQYPNILSLMLMFLVSMQLLSRFKVVFLIFNARGVPCLAVSGQIIPLFRSRCLRVKLQSSIGLSPVSFDMDIAVASFFDELAIIELMSFSSGIFGSFRAW